MEGRVGYRRMEGGVMIKYNGKESMIYKNGGKVKIK